MTLRSVLTQRDVDVEVIVVDEASTDERLRCSPRLADARIRVIRHETPRGVASARNRGAADARGEWLAFVDDDDLWAPDKLVRQLDAAEAVGRHWVYTGCVGYRRSRSESFLAVHRSSGANHRRAAAVQRNSRRRFQRRGPTDDVASRPVLSTPACVIPRIGKCGFVWQSTDLQHASVVPWSARRLHTSNSSLDIAEIVRGTKLIEAMHHTTADWGRLHWWMAQSSSSGRPAAGGCRGVREGGGPG